VVFFFGRKHRVLYVLNIRSVFLDIMNTSHSFSGAIIPALYRDDIKKLFFSCSQAFQLRYIHQADMCQT